MNKLWTRDDKDQVIAKDLYPVIIKGINYRHYFGNIAT